jgi:hypothetical protein
MKAFDYCGNIRTWKPQGSNQQTAFYASELTSDIPFSNELIEFIHFLFHLVCMSLASVIVQLLTKTVIVALELKMTLGTNLGELCNGTI